MNASNHRNRKLRSAELHRQVRDFAARFGPIPERDTSSAFTELAREIAGFQSDHNPNWASLIRHVLGDGQGLQRVPVEHWPAITVDAFRASRVATFPESEEVSCFHTSGTTGQLIGRHPARELETYTELSVLLGRAALLDPDASLPAVLALAPPRTQAQHSSLGFMMHAFMQHFDASSIAGSARIPSADDPMHWFLRPNGVDVSGLSRAVDEATQRQVPVLLLTTSFALVMLFDSLNHALPLPPGSVVMTTGGFKGRTRSVSQAWLGQRIQQDLAVPPERVVAEYGMTELSSQLYAGGLNLAKNPHDRFVAPAWLRVVAVDPQSLEPLEKGQQGLAKFIDLANVDTALSVLTQDLIIVHDDGIELVGRRPDAPLRGCSLGVEAFLAAASSKPRGPASDEPPGQGQRP